METVGVSRQKDATVVVWLGGVRLRQEDVEVTKSLSEMKDNLAL